MNAIVISYEGPSVDYQADYRRSVEMARPRKGRKFPTARRGARPVGFNGLHRRRNKRWTW